jgi:hypothetical protein
MDVIGISSASRQTLAAHADSIGASVLTINLE